MKKSRINYLKLFTISTLIFLYLPIIVTILYSFNSAPSGFKFESFTIKWYKDLFNDKNILSAMETTLSIGILSSIFATMIGTLGAYAIYKSRGGLKKSLLFFNNIPIINPDIITGASLFIFFMFIHFQLGFASLLISHIMFNIPYVVLIIYPKLRSTSSSIVEAAYDLGANEAQTFIKIILPDIKGSIISAFLICFTLSLDDFMISFFTTGNNTNNLSILIYSIVRRGIKPSVGALAALMFIVIFILLFIINKKFGLTKFKNLENTKK